MLTDFIVIGMIVYFISFLENSQIHYNGLFEDTTIEMSDFCLRFENLPYDGYYEGDEQIMKARMWTHLNALMKEEAEEKGLTYDPDDAKYQILDINFAYTNMKDIKCLFEMNKIRKKIKQIEARRRGTKSQSKKDGFNK